MERVQNERLKLDLDKQNIENELQAKEQALRQEQIERERMEQMLSELNSKLVSGGQHLQEKEAEQLKAKREYQKKLKEQRKKAQRLQEEKAEKENQLLLQNSQFKSMEEQLLQTRQVY